MKVHLAYASRTELLAEKGILTLGFLAWTSFNVLEAPAEANLRLMVTDRPQTIWCILRTKMAIAISEQQSLI